jgi:hypothetical protein
MDIVSQLSNALNGSLALDLDTDHDNVMKRETGLGAVFVSALSVVRAALFGDQGKDIG